LGSDRREWVWKKSGEDVSDRVAKPTVKFGGGSLMIWGCMTAKRAGYMCKIDGRMDAGLYKDIFDEDLIRSIKYYRMNKRKINFQQDNDPKHTSHTATQWLQSKKIKILEWPAQSPDLNPIEHLWHHLKRQLSKYDPEPESMDELWECVQDEWNKITIDDCLKLIENMPRRVTAVLKAKGSHTKY
jgi:hypothetical protein